MYMITPVLATSIIHMYNAVQSKRRPDQQDTTIKRMGRMIETHCMYSRGQKKVYVA